MENKKLVKIVLIIIGIFFALALIETSIRGIAQLASHLSQKNEEKRQEEKVRKKRNKHSRNRKRGSK